MDGELKLNEAELKELNRKISTISSMMASANTLERDKNEYLSGLLKTRNLDPKKVYNVDSGTGIITEQNQSEAAKKEASAG